jgi:hypothetical protein
MQAPDIPDPTTAAGFCVDRRWLALAALAVAQFKVSSTRRL